MWYMINMYPRLLERDQISYAKYGGYERPQKSGRRSYPHVQKTFKTQRGRIPVDPPILWLQLDIIQ